MKISTSRGLLILVSFSLILSMFASVGPIGEVQASGPTYTPHGTILINSIGAINTLKNAGDCTGSGTAADPYVISGFDINGTGGICIDVYRMSVYLVISNCYLHGSSSYGVRISLSNNVTVTNSNCSDNYQYGIFLDGSGNNTLTNNVCIDGAHGIFTSGSGDNTMTGNTCRATRACAIMLSSSSNRNTLSNNLCYSSGDNGIYVLTSNDNTISNNTIRNNIGHAVHLANSNYNHVYGNEMLYNNGSSAIYAEAHDQADDTGVGNTWNTASYGNYWSDWTSPDSNGDGIVDNPYPIAQGNAQDHFPLATYDIPGTTVPGMPSLSESVGITTVSLSWTTPNNGGATIDYYIVYQNGTDIVHRTTNSYAVTGLTTGQSYSFRVAAHNSAGLGAQSSAVLAIPCVVPDAPTALTAVAGNGQVNLSWTPGSNGGSAIDYYVVYQDGNALPNQVTGTAAAITGLTNGQSYSFTVAAHNFAGLSSRSGPASSTPVAVPGIPASFQAVSGDAQVSMSWTAPGNGGAAIDYYIVYQNGIDVKHPTGTATNITGLTNGQAYSFTVAAHSAVGTGPQSSSVSATPNVGLTVPGAPTGLTATQGDSQAALSWTAPTSNGGAAIDYYTVYVNGVARSNHYVTALATITGLTNGQQYTFTVAAHNSVGTGLQSTAATAVPSAVKTVPGAPTGLLTTPGNGQVSLFWTAPSNNGGAAVDYYLVYVNGVARSDHYSTVSATVAGLTNGQQYSFAIAAHNSVGLSARSTSVSATPTKVTVPGVPLHLNATEGSNQITLSWASPSSDGGAAIDYYIVYQEGVDVSHPSTVSTTITGLSNGQIYNFTVAAHNSAGTGPRTSPVFAAPNSGASLPDAPTGLNLVTGSGSVTLSWTAPSGTAIVDYYIIYQDGIDVDHTSSTSATIKGLTNGQNYSFAVAAHNSGGAGAQSAAQSISPGSAAQHNGTTLSLGDGSVVIYIGILALLVIVIVAVIFVVKGRGKR